MAGPSSTHSGWWYDIPNSELEVIRRGTSEITITSSAVSPSTSDGAALGTASLMWSDLFMASGSVINFNASDVTITHASNALTIESGNLFVGNGFGLIVGSNTQLTTSVSDGASGTTPELQVLGTGSDDSSLMLGNFGTGGTPASLYFLRSRNTAIGSNTIVTDGTSLGSIVFAADDGNDYLTLGAMIRADVDGDPGENDMPGRLEFYTTADDAAAPTERWRISQVGNLTSLAADAANAANVDGGIIATGGIAFTDVANAWIDDASRGSGTVAHYIGNQAITTSSDMRLKTDIEDSMVNATDMLRKFRVVDYSWGENYSPHESYNARGRWMGMIAQEAIEVAPWIINAPGDSKDCWDCRAGLECEKHVNEDGTPQWWFVNYDYLVPTVVKGFQELDVRLREDELILGLAEEKIDALEEAYKILQGRIHELETT